MDIYTNQRASKSGLDLNGGPFLAYPDAVGGCESDDGGSRLSSGDGSLSRSCRGRGDGDGVLVVHVFCWERVVDSFHFS